MAFTIVLEQLTDSLVPVIQVSCEFCVLFLKYEDFWFSS